MAASTHQLFGDQPGTDLATPGSYGEAPRGFRLPAATRVGRVQLQVASLARSLPFYEQTLGLRPLRQDGARVVLAAHADDTPLVELHEHAGARPAPSRGRTGLYHFAVLLPDRPSLGRFVRHLEATGASAGSADHLVSEAFYLRDPDNLGIEVYADRPRATWRRVGRELMMATDPADVAGLVRAAGDQSWTGMPAGTKMGHLHLHVGDIDTASAFYSEALGFDRMVWRYPGALFLGADGYHHHLGTNTWAGGDASPPAAGEAQLLEWTLELPDVAGVQAVRENLTRAGFAANMESHDEGGQALLVRDPWGTPLRLQAAATA